MKLFVLDHLKSKASNKIAVFFNLCNNISNKDYFTNIYGLARTILALGLLITLVFNDTDNLYAEHLFNKSVDKSSIDQINIFHLFGFEHLWLSKVITILILLAVISGFYPRFTGALQWWVSYSFFTSAAIVDGGDQIISVLTLALIPITLMDDRKNHWINNATHSIYKNFIAFIVFTLIELQVAIVYLQAGIHKPMKVLEWNDGTAIYYWFNHDMFGAPEWLLYILNPLMDIPSVIATLNWAVIIFEVLLFGAFFMNKNRRVKLLKYAILFHFGILIIHGLVSFFFAMTGALILFLSQKNKPMSYLKKYF